MWETISIRTMEKMYIFIHYRCVKTWSEFIPSLQALKTIQGAHTKSVKRLTFSEESYGFDEKTIEQFDGDIDLNVFDIPNRMIYVRKL